MTTTRTSPSISSNTDPKNRPGKRVFVGLSGGVDSAVSAALLQQAGYDVTGVFIKVWSPSFLPCTWREERRDAMRVAAKLGIPFLFFDFEKEYKKGVADYMIEEYRKGRTPNPDVMCNREVKFGAFWKKAKEMGADYIATGHYAQVREKDGSFFLMEGNDAEKDQSYFLWTLTEKDLEHVLFPVGHIEKKEVRSLAEKFAIPVAAKKDSQGICFIGEITLEEFLGEFIETKPGDVLNTKGEAIGIHTGALYYTIGERHGFTIDKKSPHDSASYVVSKDMIENTITVSNNSQEILSLSPKAITAKDVNWLMRPEGTKTTARIRYRGEKLPVLINSAKSRLLIEFEKPVIGVSPGQSIVFYEGPIMIGGGIINAVK
ncbi:MAG: tRNA-specific 2-thiouridylase MnmA [Parcubacteria group bacterium]|nr:tRNA-specific 2-thiouridylase MnmA [Parcubacteria group bacterium]